MDADKTLKFHDVELRLPELRARVGGREIYLSLSEMRLLLILLSEPYTVFPILELIARMDLTGPQALHVVVAHTRAKLGGNHIHTARGIGYAFARNGRIA